MKINKYNFKKMFIETIKNIKNQNKKIYKNIQKCNKII